MILRNLRLGEDVNQSLLKCTGKRVSNVGKQDQKHRVAGLWVCNVFGMEVVGNQGASISREEVEWLQMYE